MREVSTTVYEYSELSERAKERARQWWIEGMDSFWSECVTDDAKECAAILGIEIDDIYFSGFWSQGDGACFTGSYSYAKVSAARIRQHAPQDSELHRIADSLQSWQRMNFYRLEAKTKHHGRYYHEFCMTVEVRDSEYEYRDVPVEGIADCLRDFARWIYRKLKREYDYQTSEECIADCMAANEYTFTKEGKRFE